MSVESSLKPNIRPRSIYRLMFDRSIGGIFWGKLFTTTGMWMHSVIAAIVVFDHTGSALMVGFVSAAQYIPQLLLAPLSGALADRGYGWQQVLLGRLITVMASSGLAVLVFLGGLDGPAAVPLLLVASLVLGTGFAVGGSPLQAVVPDLVRPGELAAAMALNSAPMTVARVTGPIVGVLVVGPFGPGVALAISAACHLFFLALLFWSIQMPKTIGARRMKSSAGVFRIDLVTVIMLVTVAVAAAAAEPPLTLAPPLSAEYEMGSSGVAEMSIWFGVGAMLGVVTATPILRLIGVRWLVPIGLLLLALSSLGVAGASSWGMVTFVLAIGGVGFSWAVSAATTSIQARVPANIRGRVMAWWLVAYVGARPVGASALGLLADATSTRGGFMFAAAGAVIAAVLCVCTFSSASRRAGKGNKNVVFGYE